MLSRDFVNFMPFLNFLDAPFSRTFIYNLISWYIEGIQEEVYILVKFHLCLICSSRVFKYQKVFVPAEGTIVGCFWVFFYVTSWNVVKFV